MNWQDLARIALLAMASSHFLDLAATQTKTIPLQEQADKKRKITDHL